MFAMSFTVPVIFSRTDLCLPMTPPKDRLSGINRREGRRFPNASIRELKLLEAVQRFLDATF